MSDISSVLSPLNHVLVPFVILSQATARFHSSKDRYI